MSSSARGISDWVVQVEKIIPVLSAIFWNGCSGWGAVVKKNDYNFCLPKFSLSEDAAYL